MDWEQGKGNWNGLCSWVMSQQAKPPDLKLDHIPPL
nr:hypothetical protein Q903MT_gene5263 [Picea sitchensis]